MIKKGKSGKIYYRLTVAISKELVKKADLKETDELSIDAEKDTIIIRKKK